MYSMKTDFGRIERALSQRLYLLNFDAESFGYTVQGSTGSNYNLIINPDSIPEDWYCTCPDYKTRKSICKHMVFVLFRVLRLPVGHVSRLLDLDRGHLQSIFNRHQISSSRRPVKIGKSVSVSLDRSPTATRKPIESDCPICFEEMKPSDQLVWCKFSCGNNLHKGCYVRWAKRNNSCVYCRAKF